MWYNFPSGAAGHPHPEINMEEEPMKKIISILLAASLVFGLMPVFATPAAADEVTVIDHVDVTFDVPEYGEEIPWYWGGEGSDDFQLSEGIYISSVTFNPISNDTEDSSVMASDRVYQLFMEVTPLDGYTFDFEGEKPIATVNGEECGTGWTVSYIEGTYETVRSGMSISWYFVGKDVELVDCVSFDVPAAEVGADMRDINVGEKYRISYYSWTWTDAAGEWNSFFSDFDDESVLGTFEDGGSYSLIMELKLNPGYWFVDRVNTDIQGASVDAEKTTAYLFVDYDFRTPISEVSIIGVGEPREDLDETQITVPEDANYQIADAYYYYNAGDYIYAYLMLQIEPLAGYCFDEIDGITVDGLTLSELQGWSVEYSNSSDIVSIEMIYEQVNQEKITIESVELELPQPSENMSDSDVILPADAPYSLWYFDGNVYYYDWWIDGYLYLGLRAADGYGFTDDTEILINGTPLEELTDRSFWRLSGYGIDFSEIILEFYYSESYEMIEEDVFIEGWPEDIEVGSEITEPELTVESFLNQYDYTCRWLDAEYQPVSGTFQEGQIYWLEITLTPAEGWDMADVLCVVQMDSNYDWVSTQYVYPENGTATALLRYSTMPAVGDVTISVTEPVAGEIPAAPVVTDGEAVIYEYEWVDVYTGEAAKVFEEGNAYELNIYLKPQDGYEFGDFTAVTINDDVYYCSDEPDRIHVSWYGSLEYPLERVDITVPNLYEGGTIDIEGITVSDGCAIEYAWWYAMQGDVGKTFGKDHYYLDLSLVATAGYCFSEDTEVYINGEKVEIYVYGVSSFANVQYEISFLDAVDSIDLGALPEIQAGGDVSSAVVTVPEDAEYYVELEWGYACEGADIEQTGDTFEEGKLYYLVCYVYANEGYEFTDDTQFTLGGRDISSYYGEGAYGLYRIGSSYAFFAIQINLGANVVESIDLTTDAPVPGAVAGEIEGAAGGNINVGDQSWICSPSDDWNEAKNMEKGETFQDGWHYWLVCYVEADAEWFLSDNPTVTLNGEEVEIVMYQIVSDQGIIIVYVGQVKASAPSGGELGDVNGDGYVDSDDAALILKYDVGLIDELYEALGDVNGDGYVDSDDAALILKYDVGLIEGF